MPAKKTIERARKAKREGKPPTTQAGAFVRKEIEHIREGKHGGTAKRAIAIGLSKARRASVKVISPKKGTTSRRPRKAKAAIAKTAMPKAAMPKAAMAKAEMAAKPEMMAKAPATRRKSPKRARAAKPTLKRTPRAAAAPRALARQGRQAARRRKKAASPRSRTKRAASSSK